MGDVVRQLLRGQGVNLEIENGPDITPHAPVMHDLGDRDSWGNCRPDPSVLSRNPVKQSPSPTREPTHLDTTVDFTSSTSNMRVHEGYMRVHRIQKALKSSLR